MLLLDQGLEALKKAIILNDSIDNTIEQKQLYDTSADIPRILALLATERNRSVQNDKELRQRIDLVNQKVEWFKQQYHDCPKCARPFDDQQHQRWMLLHGMPSNQRHYVCASCYLQLTNSVCPICLDRCFAAKKSDL